MQYPNEVCWCGGKEFRTTPHPDYLHCTACGSAKLKHGLTIGQDPVSDEASHLYGEHYWDEHMRQFGYPTLAERARGDFSERAQYWLKYLLEYRTPPARTLEIGCAHGGFVKLLSAAGYDAAGMEMSPGIIAKAQQWFGINMYRGPIEHADRELGLFDVILLFDVLEHFGDPTQTMGEILKHVAPDGIVVIQTPNYDDVGTKDWHQFKSPEHTFLFSAKGVREFYRRLGFEHVAFEPTIFGSDMFVFASRKPMVKRSEQEIVESLLKTPDGRLVLGMQDLYRSMLSNPNRDLGALYGTSGLAKATAGAAWKSIRRRLKLG